MATNSELLSMYSIAKSNEESIFCKGEFGTLMIGHPTTGALTNDPIGEMESSVGGIFDGTELSKSFVDKQLVV